MGSDERLEGRGRFRFVLTADEHALLLREAVARDKPADLLVGAMPHADGFGLDLDLVGLASLARLTSLVAEDAADPMARLVATELCMRLADYMVAMGLGKDPALDGGEPVVVRDEQKTVLGVGISGIDLRRLITDWEGERPAIRLNRQLAIGDVGETRFFGVAQGLLQTLEAEGGVTRATPKGNLNRKFVQAVVDCTPVLAKTAEWLREEGRRNTLNEEDSGDLHHMRLVLMLARLIARRHSTLRITKRGHDLLDERRAGELYEVLFRTFFREFNLAYLDWYPMDDDFQHLVGLGLFYIHVFGDTWRRTERLGDMVMRPLHLPALKTFPDTLKPHWVAESRLLRPLEDFGLLEFRDAGREGYSPIHEVRKTPLFDALISFDLGSGRGEPGGLVHPEQPGVH